MRIALGVLGICAAACGDNFAGGSRVVLVSTEVGRGEGVDLPSLAIREVANGAHCLAETDFCIGQAMVISLRGHDETFCSKGRDFARVGDIPADLDACPGSLGNAWSSIAYLGASAEHTAGESDVAGDGYLVRDRDGTLYRMRVVSDAYDADGVAAATLDIEPVR
jgi:hypothetical protein